MKNTIKLITAAALSTLAVGGVNAALTTVADYNFATFVDGTADLTTAGFDVINGNATISGGQLVLDGTGGISDTTSAMSGVTDNFVIEAIVAPDALVGAGYQFDFIFSHSAGAANSGYAAIHDGNGEDTWTGIIMGTVGFGGPTAVVGGQTISVAYVRDAGVSTIYVDGVSVATTSNAAAPSPDRLNLGWNTADGAASLMTGEFDRVRMSTFTAGNFATSDLIAVPEPSSTALLGLGGLALILRRRK